MATSLLPSKFWGLDALLEAFPKFYIKDLLEMPEIESQPGIFQYRDHPISTVDVIGVVVKVDERDNIFIYAVDDGTGVIGCSCFKNTSDVQPETARKLKEEFQGGPLEGKLDMLLDEKELCSRGFSIGELLHVRGVLQVYRSIRGIKAYHCVRVDSPAAEVERMLQLPKLYQNFYDKPFVLPRRLEREVSSLPAGAVDQQSLSLELQHQEEVVKQILAYIDESESQTIMEQSVFDSIKHSSSEIIKNPVIWRKALSNLETTGHLCSDPSHEGEYLVIAYNQQLHQSIREIIKNYMEHQTGSEVGCHFLHIYDELRKRFPFSQLNKPSLWKCLGVLEEQSEIISASDKHFILFT